MMWVVAGLTCLVGASLGLFGGGGSVLMVPLLVYVAGVPARSAIAISLLVVGGTTAAALLMRGHRRSVRWGTGMLFGAAGMLSAYAGGRAAAFVPDAILLPGFALFMIAAGVAMFRHKSAETCELSEGSRGVRIPLALALGGGIGFMSGLAGAGGGFLVVPALVLFAGLDMGVAISTSLFVVAAQSTAGFLGHMHDLGSYSWPAVALTGLAIAGSIVGARFRGALSHARLRRGFAAFVAAVGVFVLIMHAPHSWFARLHLQAGHIAALLGGVIIGLAAAMLWLFNGRVAGVSGIAGGVLHSERGDRLWRALFMLGLVLGGVLVSRIVPGAFETATVAPATVVVAGLLVGFGTALGNGCTSGHGVCGVSRLSPRSLAAVGSFMGMGMLTVFFVRHVFEVLL